MTDQQQPGASEQGDNPEPYVQIWLEQPSGHEMAMLSAADYRHIKTERDGALVEVDRLQLRGQALETEMNFRSRLLIEKDAEAERLRVALKDAIELAEDAIPYVSEHLQKKWGYAEELAKLHAALDAATPKPTGWGGLWG